MTMAQATIMIQDIPELLILQYIPHFMPPLIVYKSDELIQPKNRSRILNSAILTFNEVESGILRRHITYILYEYGAN
jgi:hypothetical protein